MKGRAAQIWNQLERELIEHCGLPAGRMLDIARARLIRKIGDALGKSRAPAAKSVRPALPIESLRTQPLDLRKGGHDHVNDDVLLARRAVALSQLPADWHRSEAEIRRLQDEVALNQRIAAQLDAMLERSCSRRVGYDGDESVSY